MSLHAELSDEARHRLHAQRRNSTITSMIVALLVLVLLGLLLAFIFISPLLKEVPVIVSYQSPPVQEDRIEPKKMTQRLQAKPSSPSSSSVAKVIAANVAAPTAVPVPDVEFTEPSIDFGANDGFGEDWGSGGFTDGGETGGGGMFGSPTGPGLKGTFYDLKQDPSGKPTEMATQDFEKSGAFDVNAPVNQVYDDNLGDVIRRDLEDNAFTDFYRAAKELRLTQLYIPRVEAAEAPNAFQIGDKVQGRRWVIAYRGKVTVPESGKFRFVGFADDVLVVLVNNRDVLDGSLRSPLRGADRRKSFTQQHTVKGWNTFEGDWMKVEAGEVLDLKILTGERPGGHYSGYLLIEKDGVEYPKDDTGARKLPLFKMLPSEMPKRGATLPDLAPDTSWSIWRSTA